MPTALESLLDPIGRTEFRERYYGKQPLLVRGRPDKFADLFTWDDLNRLLNTSHHPHPHVEVATAGTHHRSPTARSIVEECRAGASLVFRELQLFEPKVGELAHALEAETGEPVFAALVMSQPSHATFERHWDRYDGIVVQLHGRKAWSVYDTPVEKPIVYFADNVHEPATNPVLECELAPGDLLYVPRGHWHEALAQGGLSLHITLALKARTGIDFLMWMIDELRGDVRFRQELPLWFAEETAGVREARLREHIDRLVEILNDRLRDPATIRSFIEHCDAAESDVRRFDFPAQLL